MNLRGRGPTLGGSMLCARRRALSFTFSLLILPDKIQLKENNADMISIFKMKQLWLRYIR